MSLTAAGFCRRALVGAAGAGAAMVLLGTTAPRVHAAAPPWATEPDVSGVPAGNLRSAALLAAPSIVSVDAQITGRLHDASGGQEKTYDLGFGGTGFFASSDGYVVTAAHVAAPSDEQVHIDFVDQRIDEEHHCTRTSTESCRTVEGQYEPDLLLTTTVQNVHVTVYVQTQDMSPDNVGLHAVVAASSPSGTKDVAVLKVDMHDAPVLIVGPSLATIDTPVAVEGYPESKQDAPDPLIPTVTAGRVTDTRHGDVGFAAGATVVETDARIEHGNSGGPGIDDTGAVVGIVSYGPTTGRNYMVSATDIAGVLSTTPASNKLGHADQLWRDGLRAQATGDAAGARQSFADCSALGSIEVGCRARTGQLVTPQGPPAQQNGGGAASGASAAIPDLTAVEAAEWMGGGIAIGLLVGIAATLLAMRLAPRRPAGTVAGVQTSWGQQQAVVPAWSWRWGPNGWMLVAAAQPPPPPAPRSPWVAPQSAWGAAQSAAPAAQAAPAAADPWAPQAAPPSANPWATQPVWGAQPAAAPQQVHPSPAEEPPPAAAPPPAALPPPQPSPVPEPAPGPPQHMPPHPLPGWAAHQAASIERPESPPAAPT